MQAYLQSIRSSALSILDRGRPWDGGIFQLIGDNRILFNVATNKTFDKRLLMGDVKATVLSGGSLMAIVFAALVILALLAVILISVFCRRKPASQKYPFGSKLQTRVNRVNQQLPISLLLLVGIVCAIVLIMSLVPLVLSFATNSRLHASVSDTQTARDDTLANQIQQVFHHVDNFLRDLVPQAEGDVVPVVQRTLEMTAIMKNKSQAAYQHEFRQVIGANSLTEASSDLLDRIDLFYNAGVTMRVLSDDMNLALNDLSNMQLYTYETECQNRVGSIDICRNHTDSIAETMNKTRSVYSKWSEQTAENGTVVLKDDVKAMQTRLYDLVGTLDATGNTPEKQREIKEEKVNVSIEFNQNISRIFDRELNSTEFVLNGVKDKLADLDGKLQSARESLQNRSARVQATYATSSSKFESIRFGATTVLLVLLLITLVCLSTGSAIILLVPNAAKDRSRSLICSVYASYATYTVSIIFVCIMFCLTSYLQTEGCRYMYEGKTADSFLVPEVNAVIAELKDQAARDPNKTDAIPLKAIGRLIGGILDGCQANQPLLLALNAVDYIDTEASNSAQASLEFKEKGRDILRREMSRANLEVLRDKSMEDKMKNLRVILQRYESVDFLSLVMRLARQRDLLLETQRQLLSMQVLNEYIHPALAEDKSAKTLSQTNRRNIPILMKSVDRLLNVTDVAPLLKQLEKKKDVVTVIDLVIASNRQMDRYLSDQALWTDTAVEYYTKHVIEGSANESKAIADSTTIGILSSVAKCHELYNVYQAFVGIPCKSLLYPMSILWFCISWFLWFAVLFSMLVHLSLACFIDRPSQQQQQQQQQPIDNSMPLSSKYRASNGDHATTTTATDDGTTVQNPLLSDA